MQNKYDMTVVFMLIRVVLSFVLFCLSRIIARLKWLGLSSLAHCVSTGQTVH